MGFHMEQTEVEELIWRVALGRCACTPGHRLLPVLHPQIPFATCAPAWDPCLPGTTFLLVSCLPIPCPFPIALSLFGHRASVCVFS